MCDYSLHAVATRPAEVGETLVSTKFQARGTRGFASPNNRKIAVCLRPGTELAFEHDVQTGGMMFRKSIGARLARFRQIDTDKPHQHHDALEFSNGAIVLVTDLTTGHNGIRYFNCLQTRSGKSRRRPDLQLGRPPPIEVAPRLPELDRRLSPGPDGRGCPASPGKPAIVQ